MSSVGAARDVDYDVIVVGSGFGGSVTALRLTEKGYRVGVIEAGRRFADDEFAATSWDVRRFLWAPQLGCYGIQRIHRLPHVTVLRFRERPRLDPPLPGTPCHSAHGHQRTRLGW